MAKTFCVEGVSIIDHPQLANLSAVLKAFDAGDRVVLGRLELFTISRRRLSRQQHEDLQRRSPHSYENSPLGPLTSDTAQNLLQNLLSLVTVLYSDHDCTRLTPDDFQRAHDISVVVSTINHRLAEVVDRTRRGFLHELWQAVQEAIDLAQCDVYALSPRAGTFEPTDDSLLSFQFFFVDLYRGRILFIGGETKAKHAQAADGQHSDMTVSEDMSQGSKVESVSLPSDLHDGEVAFGSEDDEMRD